MHNYFSKIKLFLIFSLLLFSGCDLLTTRNAEDPETGRSSYIVATTPDQLFTNLKNSFSEKVEKDYSSNFVDSSFLKIDYKFVPSSEAIVKFNILTEWNLEAEKAYFKNLINSVDENKQIVLNLQEISRSVEGTTASLNYDYSITLPIETEGLPNFYKGNAFFKINLDDNNQWVITEWIDNKTEDFPSWSELKGRFYLF
ncbi:MAG: hypothetical protein H6613_17940 [Ignavibacteriales bacterium]|nr:hypothetical protein [Ignavibacteriales bacterium]